MIKANELSVEPQKERAVRAREAASILGLGRTSFYGLVKTVPDFPQGAQLGRSRLWLVSDLLAWVRRQAGTSSRRSGKSK